MVGRAPRFAAFLAAALVCASAAAPARADGLDLQARIQGFWIQVLAQDSPSLRDRLFGRDRQETAVGRFSSQGGPSFVLDQSGSRPLLRFEGSSEIWVLRPSAGIRGDIYYRNDVGEVMLRATRLGGLTLYTAAHPGGLPCALEAGARPLRLPEHDARTLFRHLLREAARGGLATRQRSLLIEADDVTDQSAAIVGDTATVAVDALVRLAQNADGRERLTNLTTLTIVFGAGPGVRRDGQVLIVTVAPRLGPGGRPSSARIMRALLP